MRSTCVNHPPNENLLVIREWMMAACKGNGCAAALLNYFIYWYENKKNSASKAKHYNNVREQHGDDRNQDESLYQWHTTKELEAGIVGLYSARSIPKGIKVLEELGFISVHSNPNKRYKYDQTKYFMVYLDVINDWIDEYKKAKTLAKDTTGNFADRDGSFAPPPKETDPKIAEYNPQNCEIQSAILPDVTSKIAEPITKTSSLSSSEATEKENKEADFVFSEIRDLKDEALDEENINQTDKAKDQDPIPLTPLSRAAEPEKPVKQYPDPMGDRFRSGRSKITSWWTRLLADKAHTEWLEILEPWADIHGVNTDLEPHFKDSLITATIQHLKASPNLKHDLSAAKACLENYIRGDKVTNFRKRIEEAIAIEEADRRLEAMQITKPECTTTYWYLWRAAPRENGIFWKMYPQQEDASEQERKDIQSRVLDELIVKLSDRGLMHLAIANDKHFFVKGSAGIDLFPAMIADLGLYLQIQAQNYQGVAA